MYNLLSLEARALIMIAKNLLIFPNVQLARKYARICALIYASGIQALDFNQILKAGLHISQYC
jgi:hypothetical protein